MEQAPASKKLLQTKEKDMSSTKFMVWWVFFVWIVLGMIFSTIAIDAFTQWNRRRRARNYFKNRKGAA